MRKNSLISSVFAATLAATVFGARDARAWCRTTSNEDFVPTPEVPCDVGTGFYPLYWASSCVSWDIQQDASVQVDLAKAAAVEAAAFDAWSSVDCVADPVTCSGAVTGHPSIMGENYGPVACTEVQYNKTSGNANIIVFRDATWTEGDKDGTLALTTVTFNVDDGEIYDADMEINSVPSTNIITTTDPPMQVVDDLQSIMTHETGHFLGLAHTQPVHTDATMYYAYTTGATTMRTPSDDDACAICAVYPPSSPGACSPTPRHGFALGCDGNGAVDAAKTGCSVSAPGAARTTASSAATLAAIALLVSARRWPRRRSH